jgi:lysophospholipase L1-like esterase
VLDSLRVGYPDKAAIKAVGPLTTNTTFATYLLPAEDDFSLAQGGTQAIDILIDLMSTPSLSADIWVLMIGVNGLTETDPYYTPVLIDSMHARNPKAYLYVLNALPLPDSVGSDALEALGSFNGMLAAEIAQRKSRGWNIYPVDAFSAIAPDSVFPTSLMTDFVHPNQAGYDKIGAELVRVMRATMPVIPGR